MNDESDFFRRQLASVPVRNATVEETPGNAGGVELTVPMAGAVWRGLLGTVLPISKERRIALDALGRETLEWCDGRTTFREMIDRHRRQHQLSFFESRALLLGFFKLMMQRGVLLMRVPPEDGKETP